MSFGNGPATYLNNPSDVYIPLKTDVALITALLLLAEISRLFHPDEKKLKLSHEEAVYSSCQSIMAHKLVSVSLTYSLL